MKPVPAALLFLLVSFSLRAQPAAGSDAAATPPAWLTPEEAGVIAELNRVRTDPAGYAEEVIRPLAALFRDNRLVYPGEIPIRTGVSIGKHREYRFMCVIDFGGDG